MSELDNPTPVMDAWRSLPDANPPYPPPLTVAQLARLLDEFDPDLPVRIVFDSGCASTDAVGASLSVYHPEGVLRASQPCVVIEGLE